MACAEAATPTDIAEATAADNLERGLRPSFSFAGPPSAGVIIFPLVFPGDLVGSVRPRRRNAK
jgi:hypothetical protein